MNRNEKYKFLRSMGLSAELARKWRDRKINDIESKDTRTILKNNKELRRDYNNYTTNLRYSFLKEMGLYSNRAKKLSRQDRINVKNLSMRKNKVVKNEEYHRLLEHVKKEYPKVYALSLEPDITKYVRKYKNVENYGVYTKWGTLTRIEPYKHDTYKLVARIREAFSCNEKQAFYLLYLMYQYNQSMDQIFTIIETDPLWEIYEKEGNKK